MATGAIESLYIIRTIFVLALIVYLAIRVVNLERKVRTLTEAHNLIVGKNVLMIFLAAIVKDAGGKIEVSKSTLTGIRSDDYIRQYTDAGLHTFVIEYRRKN